MADARPTYQLHEIFDTAILSPSDGQILRYKASTGKWALGSASALGLSVTGYWLAGTGAYQGPTGNPNGLVIFTAPVNVKVTGIVGRLETANAGASTLSVVRMPSGTAIGSGIALHSGSFNAAGTPATNQTLTLSAATILAYQNTNSAYESQGSEKAYGSTMSVLFLNPGDSIGFTTTGTWLLATGCITVTMVYV